MHGLDFVVTSVFAAWLMVWIFHCIQQMKDINSLDVRLKSLEKLLMPKDNNAEECTEDDENYGQND